jgi:hypothetical protein
MNLRSRRVVILGTHPETLEAFDPVAHQGDEVWGMAHHEKTLLYATKAFEAHSPEIVWEHGGNAHVERLKRIANEVPLITMYQWPMKLGPYHVSHTSDQLAEEGVVRLRPQPFVESSIGYILAMALRPSESVRDIYLYGINMDGSDEYTYQRPNIAYLIGKAEGMGINVHLPDTCGLFSSQWTAGVYGHPRNIRDIIYYLRPSEAPSYES